MTRDDNYTPFTGPRPGEPPTPILIQRLWRAQKSSRRSVLSCGLYRHPIGFEARCGYGNEEDLLMSQVERTPDAAKAHADAWLAIAIDKGFEQIGRLS
jgi:hypothetical protein